MRRKKETIRERNKRLKQIIKYLRQSYKEEDNTNYNISFNQAIKEIQ